jgi:hypothetical protein
MDVKEKKIESYINPDPQTGRALSALLNFFLFLLPSFLL